MNVTVHGGIGYSTSTGALMLSENGIAYTKGNAPFIAPAPPKELDSAPWSKWGNNNLLPLEMADHLENCGVLNAAMDGKSRIAVGKGIQPFLLKNIDKDGKEDLEWVNDSEVHDWLEANNTFEMGLDLSFDGNGYGLDAGSFILNGKRDYIKRVRRIDIVNTRLEKMDSNGNINNLYLCYDWKKALGSFDKSFMAVIPLLQEDDELEDLVKRKDERGEFAFVNRRRRNGRTYYPMPAWYSAVQWVKVARSVPALKNAMFANQMQIKYVIHISEKYWDSESCYGSDWDNYSSEEKQAKIQEKYDEIEQWLVGTDKAYKTLIGGRFYDAVTQKEIPYIAVEVLDDKVKDGKLLPDSSAANSEILFAANVNPALVGAGNPGGNAYGDTSGGSNVREAFLVTMMMAEAERRKLSKIFNVVKKFNGWSDRLEVETSMFATTNSQDNTITDKKIKPRLVWRFPSGLLTTLDTGKSTKPENL